MSVNGIDQNNSIIQTRKSHAPSAGNHSKEYLYPQCDQSLYSRLVYHTISKLKLRDTAWIPINNNKNFFIVCYTELDPQSDGIVDELRRAKN
jgi:hypothetical protein